MATNFEFNDNITSSSFRGETFYASHENDVFLRDVNKVKDILAKGVQLKRAIQALGEGENLVMKGYTVKAGIELTIYKGGPDLDDNVYTFSRLQGMCACIVFMNSTKYPDLIVAIAKANGFKWESSYTGVQRSAYLSFTPGSHLFSHVFEYWPIACALYEIKKSGKQSDVDLKVYQSRFRSRDETGPMLNKIDENTTLIKNTFSSIIGEGGIRSVAIKSLINKIWPQ
ncbi:nucleocapsid [Herbert virus strain F23/CI/2004]|uniref:Nucleocapsid n=2 Tax=Herbevirus herberti TaxID=3052241 RepID=U5F073_9VIRU|nr:nucleocapsid [Herbert virus strain F23/CI/2004]AFR34025.1 nucleocapsid [Herbert virus strain F23/CI/2004]AGX32054.1 nucleocapsid [Herbevirus herberti]AGX32056.1 nucleocapsid [Herbevirus herberti]